jgi:hypothetical protein
MPLEKITTSRLPEFHRLWLSRYELPTTSQAVLSYLCDRDAGVTGLAELCARNPAITVLLSQAFDARSTRPGSEARTTEFHVSQLGLQATRRLVLDHQLRAHLHVILGRHASRKLEFRVAEEFQSRVDTSASRMPYADSAFVAGLLWDVLEPASFLGRQKTWIDSRLDLMFEHLEAAIALAEKTPGFSARRWLAASVSARCVVDAIAGLLDPSFIDQVLAWERSRLPFAVQLMLKARHLGFSTGAAGAWICERIDVLRPMADSLRHFDAPRELRGAAIEVRQMAEVLGRAAEVG